MTDNRFSRKIFKFRRTYLWINSLRIVYKEKKKNVGFMKKVAYTLLNNPFMKTKKSTYKLDMLVQKYNKRGNKYYANHFGAWKDKEIVCRDIFGEGQLIKFEDCKINVPENYDKYLSSLYGNYMNLPPENKRFPHHYLSNYSLIKPYKE